MANKRMTRRELLKISAAASVAWGIAQLPENPLAAIDYRKPPAGSEKLTAYRNGSLVLLRWNNTTAISPHLPSTS